MIALLITLADFPDFVPFSINIGAHLVNPHIRDAQTMDVWPLLPVLLRTELATAVGEAEPSGDTGEFYGGEFYTPSPALLDALPAIFRESVRPLLVVESARRMLLWHGAHVTPGGLEETSSTPLSSQRRTELRSDLAAKCSYYRARLETALRAAYPNSYHSSCSGPRRRTSGGLQITAV